MDVHVYGIKIKTRVATENTAIGLYAVAGATSELRFLQSPISGVTTWKSGRISMSGLGKYTRSINVEDGGSVAEPGSFDFKLSNIDNFSATLDAAGIKFDGCVVELWKWDGPMPGTAAVLLWTGRCKEPRVSPALIEVQAIGLSQGRVARLTKGINTTDYPYASSDVVGKSIPATFGELYPRLTDNGALIDQFMAKFIRTSDFVDEDTYTNAYFAYLADHPEIKIFPVSYYNNADSPPWIIFQTESDAGAFELNNPDDTYLIVRSGEGRGQIRQVTKLKATGGYDEVEVTLKDVFLTDLSVLSDSTRSWVQVVKIYREYKSDTLTCRNFLNSTGATVSKAELYYKNTQEQLEKIADFGFTITGANKNTLNIDGQQYSEDIDTLESVVIKPATSLQLCNTATLSDWPGLTGGPYNKNAFIDGLYFNDETGLLSAYFPGISEPELAFDRDSNSRASNLSYVIFNTATPNRKFCVAQTFGLPSLKGVGNIESIHIGVRAKIGTEYDPLGGPGPNIFRGKIHLILRRFKHTNANDGVSFERADLPINDPNVDDLPDSYYVSSIVPGEPPETNNRNYYLTTTDVAGYWDDVFGYTNFELVDCDLNTYNTYQEGGIILEVAAQLAGRYDNYMLVYEVAVIAKLSASDITSAVYSPLAGRIFNDTFGGRMTSTALVQRPKDIFETVCRLQNFSESCSVPTAGWGYAYAPTPLICTTAGSIGSFDASGFSETNSFSPALQIEDNDGYTDKVKLSLCRTFGWMSWVGANGDEKLSSLLTPYETITEDISFGEIIDHNAVELTPFPVEKTYPDITVFYNVNSATGDYSSSLSITNSSKPTYSASYVLGITDPVEAEALWNKAHTIAVRIEKTKIDKVPTTISNVTWANGAGGYNIAKNYLSNLLTLWERKFLKFTAHDQLVGEWEEGHWFTFRTPKQTGNVSKNCVVTQIVQDPNEPHIVSVKALLTP